MGGHVCLFAPFVIFSGYAGYLADRHSKRIIIVLAKVAEIVVMLLGLVGVSRVWPLGLHGAVCGACS